MPHGQFWAFREGGNFFILPKNRTTIPWLSVVSLATILTTVCRLARYLYYRHQSLICPRCFQFYSDLSRFPVSAIGCDQLHKEQHAWYEPNWLKFSRLAVP